jgi:uncharacterized protein
MAERDHIRTTLSNEQLQIALSRWDNEGGAGPDGPQERSYIAFPQSHTPLYIHMRSKASGLFLNPPAQSIVAISLFICLTFAWSWVLGFIALQAKPSAPAFSAVLSIASGFGPSIAALVTVLCFSGRMGLNTWIKNARNWRVDWRWYAVAFFMPPLVMLLAQGIHWTLGGTVPTSPAVGHIPLAITNFALVFLIGGPLGEELGWRSYALPALGSRMGWRMASLVIGVIWGLWHLPWFFTAGTAQSQMPFVVFMFNIIAAGSIIPALVVHTSLNAFAGILSIIPTAETFRPYALVTGILVAIACWLLLRSARSEKSTL